MTDRPNSSIRLWIFAGIFFLPILYLASFAPFIALDSRGLLPEPVREAVQLYATPIRLSHDHGPDWWRRFLDCYAELCEAR